jgi:deazaflavin-dependent oxidoreductase (nitroreductase family)
MARRPRFLTAVMRRFMDRQVRAYRRTGGQKANTSYNIPLLLLTTTGRRSGRPLTRPIGYGQDGDRLVVIGSNGGDDATPGWVYNLRADPSAEVELGTDRFPATAVEAEGAEYDRLWKLMTDQYPVYQRYLKKTDRRMPVIVLERKPAAEQGSFPVV